MRLLGPVTVDGADTALPLGSAMQRTVLAVLALEAGRVVPVERLIAYLWGETPPKDPNGLIQTYVSRLRSALRPVGAAIERQAHGYLLDLPAAEVDVHVFRAAVAGAATTSDSGSLREALALWRGEPLAGLLATERLERLRAGLREEHLVAWEECLERELQGGHHKKITGELLRLHEEQPLRERVLSLLLVALYRDGRRAEALQRYAAARQRLADELGIDPTPALAALHARILRDELDPAEPQAPVPPAVPRSLPYDVPDFTGRHDDVQRLAAAAAAHGRMAICVIDGMGGIGKTALAVHIAHQLADRYPDGQLFVDLRGFSPACEPAEPGEALSVLLRTMGVPDGQIPAGLAERAALWRHTIAGKRILLLLDNVAAADQARPLIPGAPGSLVLVTSRRRLTLDGSVRVSLDALDPDSARALFISVAGARAATEPEAVDEVLALCGYLPLAIRVAAARLAHRDHWSVAYLAARLRDEHGRLAELRTVDHDVHATLQLSYVDLTEAQQRLLRLLGAHPGDDVTAYAACAVLGVDFPTTERLLDELFDAHLLIQHAEGRYRFHDLLRAFVQQLPDEIERGDARRNLVDYYRQAASAAMDLYAPAERRFRPEITGTHHVAPMADAAQALRWLDAERANLIAVAHDAPGVFSRILFRYLDARSLHDDGLTLHTLALTDPDPAVQAAARNGLGNLCLRRGDYPAAQEHLTHCVSLLRAIGDRHTESRVLLNLGLVLGRLGQLETAIVHYEQSLLIAIEFGDLLSEARCLTNIGNANRRLRRFEAAADAQLRALEKARQAAAPLNVGYALFNLGLISIDRNDPGPAIGYFEEALVLLREVGDRSGESGVLDSIGKARSLQGHHQDAVAYHQHALAITEQTGNRHDRQHFLNSLGETLTAAGKPQDAVRYHEEALSLATDIQASDGQARAYEGTGRALIALGRRDDARQPLELSLALYESLGFEQRDQIELLIKELDPS
ncbi:tetratricopeptide repeat protein [Micromonospora eburnea]